MTWIPLWKICNFSQLIALPGWTKPIDQIRSNSHVPFISPVPPGGTGGSRWQAPWPPAKPRRPWVARPSATPRFWLPRSVDVALLQVSHTGDHRHMEYKHGGDSGGQMTPFFVRLRCVDSCVSSLLRASAAWCFPPSVPGFFLRALLYICTGEARVGWHDAQPSICFLLLLFLIDVQVCTKKRK